MEKPGDGRCNSASAFNVAGGSKLKYKYKVELEDLGCDLSSGAQLVPLVPPANDLEGDLCFCRLFYHTMFYDNSFFTLSIESIVPDLDGELKCREVWLPFMCQGVKRCSLIETFFPAHPNKKCRKVLQRFFISLLQGESGKSCVPYVQFCCRARRAYYAGSQFKNGDLITVVVKTSEYQLDWPDPPIVTVVPSEDRHFVPMLPKQRMMVVTNMGNVFASYVLEARASSDREIDFEAGAEGNILFEGSFSGEFGKECSYFLCKKLTTSSEVVFIRGKNGAIKREIVIPFWEHRLCPVIILNPAGNAVIHSQNIDGFVIRFFLKDSYFPVIMIMPGTPLRHIFTNENDRYVEQKFAIYPGRRCSFFHLRNYGYIWEISGV